MRFLPNPHWIPELRDHTGLEREVSDYVLSQAGAEEFLEPLRRAVRPGVRRLPAGGQEVSDAGGRLHRRQAPQRRHRGGTGPPAGQRRPRGQGRPPRPGARVTGTGVDDGRARVASPRGRPRAVRDAAGAGPARRARHGDRHRRRRRRFVRSAAAGMAAPGAAGRPADGAGRTDPGGRAGPALGQHVPAPVRRARGAGRPSGRQPAAGRADRDHRRPGRRARRRRGAAARPRPGAADGDAPAGHRRRRGRPGRRPGGGAPDPRPGRGGVHPRNGPPDRHRSRRRARLPASLSRRSGTPTWSPSARGPG